MAEQNYFSVDAVYFLDAGRSVTVSVARSEDLFTTAETLFLSCRVARAARRRN